MTNAGLTSDAEPTLVPVEGAAPGSAQPGRWWEVIRVALSQARTRFGLAILGVVVLVAVLGPLVSPHSPTDLVAPPYAHPSSVVPLGADALGRDVLSRFLHGGLYILAMAAVATCLGVALGTALGTLAGYLGGKRDDFIMRGLDIVLCFPSVVLALLLMSVVGTKVWLIVLSVALTHTPQVARVTRGATVQLAGREFIAYAESLGAPRRKIVLGEILPNITAPLTVEFGLRMTYSIAIIASLAFLGFGRQPPAADWGLMINENRGGISVMPWGVVVPVIAIAMLTVGTNLVADGLGRSLAGIGRTVDASDQA